MLEISIVVAKLGYEKRPSGVQLAPFVGIRIQALLNSSNRLSTNTPRLGTLGDSILRQLRNRFLSWSVSITQWRNRTRSEAGVRPPTWVLLHP